MSRIARIFSAFSFGGRRRKAASGPLEIGASLPNVSQMNQEGVSIDLPEAGAAGKLLVFFYPKADTPGCTKQACSLRDAYGALQEKGVRVLGVSLDKVKRQRAFHGKFALPFDLLADEDGSVAEAFGVPKMMGFAKRQAFLFDGGKLVWRDLSASTGQQAADILKVVSGGR